MKFAHMHRTGFFPVGHLLLVLCIVAIASCTQNRSYDETTARVLARAYTLNNPGSTDDMEAFVMANRSFFVAGGSAVQAMNSLGRKLTQAGINAFDPQALERASRVGGPPEMAQDVARGINEGSTGMVCLGQELMWMAAVLPSAAERDWGPFLNSKPICRGLTHQEAIERLAQLEQLAKLSGNDALFQLAKSAAQVVRPFTEDQMILMTLMYAD